MTQASVRNSTRSVAAVVVTFNRKELLVECLDGLLSQSSPVDRIFLIDNASTDGTPEFLMQRGYLGNEKCDYIRMPTNTGGAGGFYEGVRVAYEAGFNWLWLMDDDVEPLPNGLETMLSYSDTSKCLQSAKTFPDGRLEPWEKWTTIEKSGRRSASKEPQNPEYILAQTGCFEGMLIHREIIAKIGFPDRRFFIGGDDVAYGYIASKHTPILYIRKVCFLKKIKKIGDGGLLQKVRNRLKNRRTSRFYFLAVRNELLLYQYISDKVQLSHFYSRIAALLLQYSFVTLVLERSGTNFRALWRGASQGYDFRSSPSKGFEIASLIS